MARSVITLSYFGLLLLFISIIPPNEAKKKPTTPRPRTYGYCPPFYNVQCKDHCYINQTSNYTVTFQDAFDLCQSINASMPTIRSGSDQKCLERYLSGTWHSVWLGLSIGERQGKKRPSWQWADTGVKYGTYTKWSSGEPRPSTPNDFRDCAEMSAVVGEWRATDCDTFRYGVLCEVPSTPFPDATMATTTGSVSEPSLDDDDDDTTTSTTPETTGTTTNSTTAISTSSTTSTPLTTSSTTTTLVTTTIPTTTVANTSRAIDTTSAATTASAATSTAPMSANKLSETSASNLTTTPSPNTNVSTLINDAILDFITHALMMSHRKNSNHTKPQVHDQNDTVSNATETNTTNFISSTTPILGKAIENVASTTTTISKGVTSTILPTTTVPSTPMPKAADFPGNSFPFPTDLPIFEINATPPPTHPTTATPPPTTVTSGPNVQCFTMDKFYFTCRRGHLNISETNMELVSATTAIYNGDNSFDCRTVQYNLHRWILEQLGMRERRSMNDVVKIVCSKGSFDVSDFRPGMSDATTIEFTTNLSAKCMTYFTGFVEYMIRIYRSLQEAEKKDGE